LILRDPGEDSALEPQAGPTDVDLLFFCDRCGGAMIELQCKIICPNCGHRFDCSDLNIYFD